MSEQIDFTKELSATECEDVIKEYRDDLVSYVEFYRGDAIFEFGDGKVAQILDPIPEEDDPDKLDTSCVGAVLALAAKITGSSEVAIHEMTLYRLSEMLRLLLTLDKFVDMGLLKKSGNGYIFSKQPMERI